MAEKKKGGLGLQQCRGEFQIRGIVNGVERDSFYKEISTKTGKSMRITNFGVAIEQGKSVYLNLNGMERDKVYFAKREDDKTVTKDVPWADRHSFKTDGYRIIGVNLGITKTVNEQGNEENKKVSLVEYDACKYINDNLKDDVSVFTRGTIEYSTYKDKHQTKFVPSQISLCKPIDFEDDKFEVMADFKQQIVYMGIAKKGDGSYTVSAKIVGYSTIEDVEFDMDADQTALAKNLKKLSPYTAITVGGVIRVEHDVEDVEEDDCWGAPDPFKKVNSATRKLVINRADKDSIDTELYSEEAIEEAIAKTKVEKQAKSDFGDDDDGWGTTPTSNNDDDDDLDW